MQVVPVIDLKDGRVVHARRGARDRYEPIETALCQGSAPGDVIAGLLDLYPFSRLYIADLDAIAGGSGHAEAIAEILAAWPDVEVWVDSGVGSAAAARAWLDRSSAHLVLGSESQVDAAVLGALADEPRTILSLDFRNQEFQGPPGILARPEGWPSRLIVMTLAKVGMQAGPDLARVRAVVALANGRAVYGAGGIRDTADLATLAEIGAAGALVATALHTGGITKAGLSHYALPRSGRAPGRSV